MKLQPLLRKVSMWSYTSIKFGKGYFWILFLKEASLQVKYISDSSKLDLPLPNAQTFPHPCFMFKTTSCSVASRVLSQAALATMSSLISNPQMASSHRPRQLPFKIYPGSTRKLTEQTIPVEDPEGTHIHRKERGTPAHTHTVLQPFLSSPEIPPSNLIHVFLWYM